MKFDKIEVDIQKNKKQGDAGEYPVFNKCNHTLIDMSDLRDTAMDDWMHTLSIKLPNDKFVTLCIMQPSDNQSCIDMKFYGEGKHRVIGFKDGSSKSLNDQGLYSLVMDYNKEE
jgi:hypothetical protein